MKTAFRNIIVNSFPGNRLIPLLGNTLFKNSLWAIMAQISMKLFGTLIWIIIARSLGAEHFGHFSFVLAFCMILELIPNWGHNLLLVRIFKNEPEKKHANIFIQSFYLKIFLTIIASLIAYISFITIWRDSLFLFPAILMGIGFVFFKTISMIWDALYTAHEKLEYPAYMTTAENVFKFLLVLLLYYQDKLTVFNLMLIFAGSFLIKYLSGYYFARSRKIFQFKTLFPEKPFYIKMLLFSSIPFVLTSAANYIYTRVDILMLSRLMKIPEELGWYGLISTLLVSVSLFGVGIATAFFPAITRLAKEKSPDFLPTLLKVYTNTGIFGFIIAASLSLAGPFFIPLFFGETYHGAIPLLIFFIFVLPIEFWKSILYRVYYARNEEKKLLNIIVAMIGFNIIANWILGTIWGYIGIGIATFLSKMLVLFLCAFYGRLWLKPIVTKLMSQFLIYLALTLIVIGLVYWIY